MRREPAPPAALMRTLLKPALAVALLWVHAASAADYTSPESIAGSTRIDADELVLMANRNDRLVIIDSRMASDRRQGFIPGSINLPDTDTDCDRLAGIVESKDDEVIFYCNGPHCKRSDQAVVIAVGCGYSRVFWFRGGIEEWLERGLLTYKK